MGLRVGYDATAAYRQSAGIGRYTRDLLAAMQAEAADVRFTVLYAAAGATSGWLPERRAGDRYRPLPLSDRLLNALWQRLRVPVPVELVTGRMDLFHSPDFTLPYTRSRAVLTVHDLAFLRVPDCAYPTLRAYLEVAVPRSIRRADAIIAVSQNTRRDLIELLDVPEERIRVIPEGVTRGLQGRAAEGGGRYVLSVGTLEPRKNYPRLLAAYARARKLGMVHELVIAGRPGWLYEPVYEAVREYALEGVVRFESPSEGELAALYAGADAFIYPSLYEGFGIPAAEALAQGIPSAVSAVSSLPEIVGDAAVTFPPLDIDAMCAALAQITGDEAVRARLRAAGPAQVAGFTWERAARETLALYQEVAGD